MERHPHKVTIRDVAKVAGVSKSTVSLVLQESPKVAERTRKLVWQALKETGYVPNAAARTLAAGKTRVIGLATVNFNHKLTERIYFSGIVGALLESLAEKQYHLMIYNAALSFQLLVDGMLFLGLNPDHQLVDDVERARLPFAFLNRRGNSQTPYISQDFSYGAELATQHLAELGHRRIGILTGRLSIPPHRERQLGYERVMREYGDAQPIIAERHDLTPRDGYLGTQELLASSPRPSAIFVSNYELLPGLLEYCRNHGVSVPHDLSVVCYDDPWAVAAMDPPITAVRSASESIGRLGAELIVDMVEGRKPSTTQLLVQPELVIRESTRAQE